MKRKIFYLTVVAVAILCVGTQTVFADTKYISTPSGGDCSAIGNWDSDTNTCTLTGNVDGSIRIDSDNVTLDGDGHEVNGSGSDVGINSYLGTGVTIKNATVQNFIYGINVSGNSSNNTLEGNTVSSNIVSGIRIYLSDSNTLTGNTISDNNSHGIWVYGSSNNILTGNTVILTGNTVTNYSTGIYLDSSSNNTLEGNTAMYNFYGISFSSSDSNTLTENIVSFNTSNGIYLFDSSNNTLTGNIASNNNSTGISLASSSNTTSSSSNNTLTGNIASSNNYLGIFIHYSSNNTLTGNTMSENTNNFHVSGLSYSDDFDQTIDITNTVEGKPIYYVVGANGGIYDSATNAGVFYAIKCSNITIKDLTLGNNYSAVFLMDTHDSTIENVNASNNNSTGISLLASSNNTLIGNTTSSNSYTGIYLYRDSDFNTLTGNTASNNYNMGIFLYWSDSNTLTWNTVSWNNLFGIYLLRSTSNQIYNNSFIDNTTQAWNDQSEEYKNNFNIAPPIGGNFWSDYTGTDTDGDGFGEIPYTFYFGQDNFPWIMQDGWGDSDGDGIPDNDDACPDEDATGFDIDVDGCIDSMSGLAEMLETLVAEGIIAEELQNSLLSKVENAEKSADKDNICAAVNKLEALTNEVNAQRGKKISNEAAGLIVEYANSVITWLLDQLPPDESC